MKSLRCTGRRIEVWLLLPPPPIVVAGPLLKLGGSLMVRVLHVTSLCLTLYTFGVPQLLQSTVFVWSPNDVTAVQ